jgi:hypothetical protein
MGVNPAELLCISTQRPQVHARREPKAMNGSASEFNNSISRATKCYAACAHGTDHLYDLQLMIKKHQIDRDSHAHRVDRAASFNDETRVLSDLIVGN